MEARDVMLRIPQIQHCNFQLTANSRQTHYSQQLTEATSVLTNILQEWLKTNTAKNHQEYCNGYHSSYTTVKSYEASELPPQYTCTRPTSKFNPAGQWATLAIHQWYICVYLLKLLESEWRPSSSLFSSRKRRPHLFFFGLCHGRLRLSATPPVVLSKS